MKATQIKEEKQRMINLVDLAYKNDPRIKEMEEKIRVKRENEKKERLEQKIKETKDEEERLIRMKVEREEQLKKEKEELQKEKDFLLMVIKNLMAENNLLLTDENFFQMEINAKTFNLKIVLMELDKFKNDSLQLVKTFKSLANTHFALKFADDSKDSTLWMKDEIVLLQKAVKKFPAGTKNRWEKITELIKTKPMGQIIQFAHLLATSPNIKFDDEPIVK